MPEGLPLSYRPRRTRHLLVMSPDPSDFTPMTEAEIASLSNTEQLPAGAGRISDVLFQVLKYDVFCDGAAGGLKIPPAPEMPIRCAQSQAPGSTQIWGLRNSGRQY